MGNTMVGVELSVSAWGRVAVLAQGAVERGGGKRQRERKSEKRGGREREREREKCACIYLQFFDA